MQGAFSDMHPAIKHTLITLLFLVLGARAVVAQEQATPSPHGEVTLNCLSCHTAHAWKPLRSDLSFDHNADTRFELVGRHALTSCEYCHIDLRFDEPRIDNEACASCHVDVHQGRFIEPCATCHNTETFSVTHADVLHSQTSFPLTGAHRQITCESCHTDDQGGAFTTLETDCMACHTDAYQHAKAPDHAALGYPTTCTDCHTTFAWTDGTFDHTSMSKGFELVGAHQATTCESCHSSPGFDVAFSAAGPNDCIACHTSDYNEQHADTGIPTACLDCHNTTAWAGVTFDHATVADGFALVGAHEAASCESCHSGGDFEVPFAPVDQNDCLSCHASDYEEQHANTGIPTACLDCHNTTAWAGVTFDHATVADGFTLVGAHEAATCESCHAGANFEVPFEPTDQNDCLSCHASDYDQQHGGTGTPTVCLDCHTTNAWPEVTFNHTVVSGGFSLEGVHLAASCETCHSGANFEVPFDPVDQNDCLSCHASDYDQQHSGTGIPTACLDCHNIMAWADVTFDHASVSNGFGLIGAHEAASCESCHNPVTFDPIFTPTDQNDCLTCHASDYDTNHADTGYPTTCLTCHGTVDWGSTSFDHITISGGFGLVGAHEVLTCENCHMLPNLELLFTPSDQRDCFTCHATDYDEQHAGSGFETTCLTCHTANAWSELNVNHVAVADGFALVGAHETATCESCHSGANFEVPFEPSDQNDCITCHTSDYDQQHAGSGIPMACLDCHNTTTWVEATFDHATVANGFSLVGAHETASCESCHTPASFEPLFDPADQNDCLTCHAADYDQEHAGSGFPTTCLTCHNTAAWEGGTMDHASLSGGFGLVGAHDALSCESCHSGPEFSVPFDPSNQNDCLACHASEYDQQHSSSGFPTTCLTCHNVNNWTGVTMDHASLSGGFGLVGAHDALSCESCHSGPEFSVPFDPSNQNDCLACHASEYDQQHSSSGFPTTCLTCHNVNNWTGVTIDHPALSGGFDLVGAHDALSCESCHSLPDFGVPFDPADQNDCIACHTSDYNQEHNGSGFPTTCLTCHNTTTWSGATFDHASASGGYALVGAHEPLDCQSCHDPNTFDPIFNPSNQNDCIACHSSDYDQQHANTGFPTTCLTCHNVNNWTGVTIDHPALSGGFDLVGAHDALSCESCHSLPDFGVPFDPADQNDCIACHTSDYNQEHNGSGFPTTCLDCHNVNTWTGATFDHATVAGGFELVGAHDALSCESCHSLPDFGVPFDPADENDCIACHSSDYNQEHNGSGFPTTCLTCHNTTTWDGANFDHDGMYFPIYNGKHDEAWTTCSDCHAAAPDNFQTFSCLGCHEHNQSDMDDDHSEVDGYVYESNACLSCHPTGED